MQNNQRLIDSHARLEDKQMWQSMYPIPKCVAHSEENFFAFMTGIGERRKGEVSVTQGGRLRYPAEWIHALGCAAIIGT